MKKLRQFESLDYPGFVKDKLLQAVNLKPQTDPDNPDKVIGTVIEVAIVQDNTSYDCKPGESVSNLFEKFNIKVPQAAVPVQVGDYVDAINPRATVYGDYRNKISVKADGIRKIEVRE